MAIQVPLVISFDTFVQISVPRRLHVYRLALVTWLMMSVMNLKGCLLLNKGFDTVRCVKNASMTQTEWYQTNRYVKGERDSSDGKDENSRVKIDNALCLQWESKGRNKNVGEIIHCRWLCSVSLLFLHKVSWFLFLACHLSSDVIIMAWQRGKFESKWIKRSESRLYGNEIAN